MFVFVFCWNGVNIGPTSEGRSRATFELNRTWSLSIEIHLTIEAINKTYTVRSFVCTINVKNVLQICLLEMNSVTSDGFAKSYLEQHRFGTGIRFNS